MPRVTFPNGDSIEFPDGVAPEVIQQAAKSHWDSVSQFVDTSREVYSPAPGYAPELPQIDVQPRPISQSPVASTPLPAQPESLPGAITPNLMASHQSIPMVASHGMPAPPMPEAAWDAAASTVMPGIDPASRLWQLLGSSEFGKGLASMAPRVAATLPETAGAAVSATARLPWMPQESAAIMQEQVAQPLYGASDTIAAIANAVPPAAVQKIEDIKGLADFGDWLAHQAGQQSMVMPGIAAATVAGGPAGGLTAATILQTGFQSKDVRDMGKEAPEKAIAIGMLTGAMEYLPIGRLLGRTKIAGPGFKDWAAKKLAGMGQQAVEESMTEGLQAFTEKLGREWVDDNVDLFSKETLSEVLNAMAAGGAIGGVAGGATNVKQVQPEPPAQTAPPGIPSRAAAAPAPGVVPGNVPVSIPAPDVTDQVTDQVTDEVTPEAPPVTPEAPPSNVRQKGQQAGPPEGVERRAGQDTSTIPVRVSKAGEAAVRRWTNAPEILRRYPSEREEFALGNHKMVQTFLQDEQLHPFDAPSLKPEEWSALEGEMRRVHDEAEVAVNGKLDHESQMDALGEAEAVTLKEMNAALAERGLKRVTKFAEDGNRVTRLVNAETGDVVLEDGSVQNVKKWLTEQGRAESAPPVRPGNVPVSIPGGVEPTVESVGIEAKSPSEMTDDELNSEFRRLSEMADSLYNQSQDPDIKALRPSPTDWLSEDDRNRLSEIGGILHRKNVAAAQDAVAKKRAARIAATTQPEPPVTPEPPAENKRPWQMTKDEYIADSEGYPSAARDHKLMVQKALKEGLPVPPGVLKDYPDLAPGGLTQDSGITENGDMTQGTAPVEPTPETPNASKWYDTIGEDAKESVFAAMRDIDERVTRASEAENKLKPRSGGISVGAGEFDKFLEAWSQFEVLKGVRNGLSPDEAGRAAKDWARTAINQHNNKRPKDVNWQRWEGSGDHYIDRAVNDLNRAAKPSTPPTGESPTPAPAVKEPWEMTQREWAEIEPYRSKQGNMFSPEGRPDVTLGPWERRGGFWYRSGDGTGPFPDGVRSTDPVTIRRLDHEIAVRDALREGKPVPPEVLADYPDLKPETSLPDGIAIEDGLYYVDFGGLEEYRFRTLEDALSVRDLKTRAKMVKKAKELAVSSDVVDEAAGPPPDEDSLASEPIIKESQHTERGRKHITITKRFPGKRGGEDSVDVIIAQDAKGSKTYYIETSYYDSVSGRTERVTKNLARGLSLKDAKKLARDWLADVIDSEAGGKAVIREPWGMTRDEWMMSARGNPFSAFNRPDVDSLGPGFEHLERRNGFWIMKGDGTGPFPGGIRITDPRSSRSYDHRASVIQALEDGEPVPARVLAEYPDIAADYPDRTFTPDPTETEEVEVGGEGGFLDFSGGKRTRTVTKPALTEDKVKSPDQEVEEFFERTARFRSPAKTFREAMAKIKAALREAFIDLPHIERNPDTIYARERIRHMSDVPNVARENSARDVHEYIAGLGDRRHIDRVGLELLTRKIFLNDMQIEAERAQKAAEEYREENPEATEEEIAAVAGSRTPLSMEQINKELERIDPLVESTPSVKSAYEMREKLWKQVTQELVDRGVLPEEVLDKPHYVRHFVLKYMEANRPQGKGGKQLKAPYRAYSKMRKGTTSDWSTDLIEVEVRALYDIYRDNMIQDIGEDIAKHYDMTEELKAAAEKADKSIDQVARERGLVPWQFKRGNVMFRAQTVTDAQIASLQQQLVDEHGAEIASELMIPESMLRSALVVGGKRKQFFIPEWLAAQLDDLPVNKKRGAITEVTAPIIQEWKKWILGVNPIRYNLRNFMGDGEAVFAARGAGPFKILPKATKLLAQKKGPEGDPDAFEKAKKYGVINSSMSYEFGDIRSLEEFELFRDVEDLKSAQAILRAAWTRVSRLRGHSQEVTQFREDMLRYAVFLDALKKIKARDYKHLAGRVGGKVDIEALTREEDGEYIAAAKIARETVGDYGKFTPWEDSTLRQGFIPFYSWLKINTTRWPRILVNSWKEGDGARGGAVAVGGLLARVLPVYAALALWNNRDDEARKRERAILKSQPWLRNYPHLTLPNGVISTPSAISDFAEWFDIEDIAGIMARHERGQITFAQMVKELMLQQAGQTVNRVAQGLNPFIKGTVRIATGADIYPEVTKPRQFHDAWSKKAFADAFLDTVGADVRKFVESAGGKRDIKEVLAYYFTGSSYRPMTEEQLQERLLLSFARACLKNPSKTTGRSAGEAKKGYEDNWHEAIEGLKALGLTEQEIYTKIAEMNAEKKMEGTKK